MKGSNFITKSFGVSFLILIFLLAYFLFQSDPIHEGTNENCDEITTLKNSTLYPNQIGQIDEESGMVIDRGLDVVKANCSSCHSIKLVAQNNFTRDAWLQLIRWMQAEQKLWDLGDNETIILDYLEKHQAPKKAGRRKKLSNIEWYVYQD